MFAREFKLHFLAYAILISVTKTLAAIVSAKADDYKAESKNKHRKSQDENLSD